MDGFVESGAGGFSPGSSERMSRFPPTKQVFGLDNLRHHVRHHFFPRRIAALTRRLFRSARRFYWPFDSDIDKPGLFITCDAVQSLSLAVDPLRVILWRSRMLPAPELGDSFFGRSHHDANART